MLEVFRLVGRLGLEGRAEVESGLDGLEQRAQSLGGRMESLGRGIGNVGAGMTKWVTGPIVAVGAGLLGMATKAGNVADRLLDLSDITGMSTDVIQEYQHVANMAGVETEAVTRAVEGLVRRLPQIAREGGAAHDAMQDLGLSAEALASMSPDDMVDELIGALADVEDPLQRNAIGAQIFGGAWKDMAPILGMGRDEIDKTREAAREMGLVMSEDALEDANSFRQSMEELKAEFGALWMEIGTKIAPIIQDVFVPLLRERVVPAIKGVVDGIASLIDWYQNLSPAWQRIIMLAAGFLAALGPVLVIVGKIIAVIGTLTTTVLPALGAAFAFLTGPIGLAVAAVAGLIAIGILVRNNWEEIKNFFGRIWDAIVGFFQGARNAILGIVNGIIEPVKNAIGWLGRLIGLGEEARDIPDRIPDRPADLPGDDFGTYDERMGVPMMGRGGRVLRGGRAVVGEDGPEELDLPQGAVVRPLTDREAAGSQEVHHSGTIRVEGVKDDGEFVGVVEMIMDELRREVRVV